MNVFLHHFFKLFVESAPWLLLGFLVAGLLKGLLPTALLHRHLGGRRWIHVVKAAFIGAPLPLCSCGVIPAALGLRESGASKNSTISFLVATPETGVDSVSITYALMGPVMAVVRPIAAIVSAITAGLLAGQEDGETRRIRNADSDAISAVRSTSHGATQFNLSARLLDGLKFSFVTLTRNIMLWLMIGLLIAAAIQTWLPAAFLAQWGQGLPAYLVMTLIGIPMYICATASTPLAAGLLFAGLSPGAVLVFMLTGPATNIGTLGIIGRELGRRALSGYLGGVVLVSFLSAWVLDVCVTRFGWTISGAQAAHVHGVFSRFALVCAVALGVWMILLGVWGGLEKRARPTAVQEV